MTTEEAVKHLKFIKDGYQNLIDNDVRTGEAIGKDIKAEWESEKTMAEVYMKMIISLEIAIKMLESQPCEDCISRKDLLEKFTEECASECACCMYVRDGYSCGLIEDAPSVRPQRGDRDESIL